MAVQAFARSRLQSFACLGHTAAVRAFSIYHFLSSDVSPFFLQLSYFVILSLLGSFVLFAIDSRDPAFSPSYLDMLYMSTSAATVSGLNSIDTELFSEAHIVVLTLLMLLGGEVFVSLLGLLFRSSKPADDLSIETNQSKPVDTEIGHTDSTCNFNTDDKDLRERSLKFLRYIVLGYITSFLVIGSIFLILYLTLSSSAKGILRRKGLRTSTFAISTAISTFANAGIIFTNENMMAFRKNSVFLLLLIPLVLGGNTLFPVFLQSMLGVAGKFGDKKREELKYIAENPTEMGYIHLFSRRRCILLILTVAGLLALQTTLFGSLDWNSKALSGLTSSEKVVAVLFQSANTRHTGEGAFDFSLISPAVIVLFIAMMYLPAYPSFLRKEDTSREKERRRDRIENGNSSQILYLIIFVVIICMIERKGVSQDPLNFSVLSMVFEVTSAYGNVGLSMGYSCGRQLTPSLNNDCKDGSYSFSGRWTNTGKLMVIFIMVFGRMKKFHMGGSIGLNLIASSYKHRQQRLLMNLAASSSKRCKEVQQEVVHEMPENKSHCIVVELNMGMAG